MSAPDPCAKPNRFRFSLHPRGRPHMSPPSVSNIMAGPLDHLVRCFGPGIVPEAIWAALPDDVAIRYDAPDQPSRANDVPPPH